MRKLSRQQKEVLERLNGRLIQYNIDDEILNYTTAYIEFKNIGVVCNNDVKKVIDKNESRYFKYFNWVDIFIDGKIKKTAYDVVRSDIASYAASFTPPPWNKGESKYTDERLMKSSIAMIGNGNNCHKMSIETKTKANEKISKTMKLKVLNGEITPKTENRLCRNDKKIYHNSIEYRSSWEFVFHLLNPDFQYEKLRIKYHNHESASNHVYIVDFVDHHNKCVVEVKPKNLFGTSKVLMKENALIAWCADNGYKYNRFTQDDLHIHKVLIKDLLNMLSDIELRDMLFQRLSWYI